MPEPTADLDPRPDPAAAIVSSALRDAAPLAAAPGAALHGGHEAAPRATAREWLALAVLALPCLVYAMDLTVLNLALPAIAAALKPSASQLLWIVDIYGFFVGGFLITMGTLGDRFGRRALLLVGAAAFALASLAAAFATSAAMLIVWRALLGIAGATLAPSTLSLIRHLFDDAEQRRFAIGVWVASYSLGGVIGPLVGGVLLQWFGWGAVFLAAVPVMGLLLVIGPLLLPEYRDPHAGRIDLPSVALSLGTVLPAVYGCKRIAELGPDTLAFAALGAGLALGVAFVRRQRGIDYPLVDLTLFARPAFGGAIAVYALTCLAMFGIWFFVAQYLQNVLGLSPLAAGLATVPSSLAFVAGSLLCPRIVRAVGTRATLVWGLALAAAGFVALALAHGAHALAVVVLSMTVASLAMAPTITLVNELIIGTAPPQRAASASALSETSAEWSGALGIALFGSLGIAVYRHRLAPLLPEALPADLAAQALATLGGAVAAARQLPAPLGQSVRAAAGDAFGAALSLTAAGSALTLAAASVIVARLVARDPLPAERGE